MLFLKRSKKTVNFVLDDYVIRVLENSGQDISNIRLVEERMLPAGMIERGRIKDELEFYDFMRTLVNELKIRNRKVRFYVPNSLVIMRQVEIPANLQGREIKEHLMLEIGGGLHLPFENPIFDVHMIPNEHHESTNEKQQGILFAVPEDEVMKYTEIFVDVSLKPIAADVQALGIYRYYYHMAQDDDNNVYLMFELNLTSTNISIFHQHQIEFLRFQHLDIEANQWTAMETEQEKLNWIYQGNQPQLMGTIEDQIRELDRIMNFYRYSLHRGEKVVTHIVLAGDYPQLEEVKQMIASEYNIPITLLSGYLSKEQDEKLGTAFVPSLGLALKGAGH